MRLKQSGTVYTSNAYLVLGDWNRLEDVNALVDVGQDPAVVADLRQRPTGVGKRRLDRVVLTHSHGDHVGMLPQVREEFHPRVLAASTAVAGVDGRLHDGEIVRLGDSDFDVWTAYAHSADSVCLYSESSGALFSGDAPILSLSGDGSYEPEFLTLFERMLQRGVRTIYPGHGDPVDDDPMKRLRASYECVRASIDRLRGGERKQDELV
jgi:glyoxylase-like metal-dependent hydrolase (beta-lactamase superfamily II)